MTTNVEHHKRYEYCFTRLKYRQGRRYTAVKAYTVANESQNLIIFGVPRINLVQELKQRLLRFGLLHHLYNVTADMIRSQLELEKFTEVYWAKFRKIYDARKCKRFLDAKEFYGGILHVSYAPEYETSEDLKDKIQKRKLEIQRILKRNEDINIRKQVRKSMCEENKKKKERIVNVTEN